MAPEPPGAQAAARFVGESFDYRAQRHAQAEQLANQDKYDERHRETARRGNGQRLKDIFQDQFGAMRARRT